MSSRGHLFILSAPAGTGKNTLAGRLIAEFDDLVESISCTTREPRAGEIDGEHYLFLSDEEFDRRLAEGLFLEHVELFNNRYGTLRENVQEQQERGVSVVLVIDTQGALALKGKVEATFIFLAPPSMEELRRRLEERRTEDAAGVELRLARAEEEMRLSKEYDYKIINDEMEKAYDQLRSIYLSETRRKR